MDGNRAFELNIISKYRSPIYGFCIFWITLFHAYAINKVDYSFGHHALKLFSLILHNGNVAVDCFLFLSGVCLYFSFYRKPDVKAFLQKRTRRVLLPVLLINGWYWVLLLIFEGDFRAFLYRITLLRFWQEGDQSIWFVSLIMVLYILYPGLYRFIYKQPDSRSVFFRTLVMMLLSYLLLFCLVNIELEYYEKIEIAVTRIPVFIIGCGCGKAVYEGRIVKKHWKVVPVVFSLLFFLAVYLDLPKMLGYYKRCFFLVGGIGIVYCLAFLFDMLTRGGRQKSLITDSFGKLGSFSLEIYLSAGVWNQMLRKTDFYEMGTLPLYLVMLVIAYVFAYAVYKVENLISEKR